MKHTNLAFIIALGLATTGLAYAANPTNNESAVYERDLAFWNGAGQSINTLVVSQRINTPRLGSQKLHFEYDDIYEDDLASMTSRDA
jgi:hypothetical protein